jgi:hypothetical protein
VRRARFRGEGEGARLTVEDGEGLAGGICNGRIASRSGLVRGFVAFGHRYKPTT